MFRIAIALAAVAASAAMAGGALPADRRPGGDEAWIAARTISFQFRTGRYELASKAVALLEEAVKAHPEDVRLWNALGTAYFQQVTADVNARNFANLPVLIGRARAAHARALALDPDDPEALAGHGTALAVASPFTRSPEMASEGLAQMSRAVDLAPESNLVRLQRGFTSLGVGAPLLDPTLVEADLKHLIGVSDGSQAGDVLHVLLGDVYAETGKPELARAEYAAAARANSPTRAMAEGRLQALGGAGPAAAEIARLRNDLGGNCVMCHAP